MRKETVHKVFREIRAESISWKERKINEYNTGIKQKEEEQSKWSLLTTLYI